MVTTGVTRLIQPGSAASWAGSRAIALRRVWQQRCAGISRTSTGALRCESRAGMQAEGWGCWRATQAEPGWQPHSLHRAGDRAAMTHRAEPPGRLKLTNRPKASLNIGQTRAGRVVMEAGSHYEAKAHLTSRPTAQGPTHLQRRCVLR